LRFPEFSGEWKECRLSELLEFKNGLNPDAKKFGSGIKFISVMDILNNTFITHSNIRATVLATPKEQKEFSVNFGDILFQRSSETLEDVGQANVYIDSKPAVFGGFVIRGRKIGDYNPMFFRYLLSTPTARKKIIVKGAGAQHFNIGQDGLSKVHLNFPSLEEQEKIANTLFLIDERITTQKKVIERLETLINGLAVRLTSGGTANTALCDCAECKSSTLKESHQLDVGLYPVYGATGIVGYTNTADVNGNGVLIIKDGSGVGTVRYVDKPFSFTGTLNCLKAKVGYNIQYIYYCLLAFNFTPYKTGLAIPHIYFKEYGKAKFYCPSIEEQNRIVSILSSVERKIELEKSILNQLLSEKSYLLSAMFI
jgi:type I restriction enzyme S subunit